MKVYAVGYGGQVRYIFSEEARAEKWVLAAIKAGAHGAFWNEYEVDPVDKSKDEEIFDEWLDHQV